MQVTLVDESPNPGGVCVYRGCIPSKALLRVARLINESRKAAEWGLTFTSPKIDLDKLRKWKNDVIGKLTGGAGDLCRMRGINKIQARGSFVDSQTLELKRTDGKTERLTFEHCILATGSLPAKPPIFDIGDDRVMDSTGGARTGRHPRQPAHRRWRLHRFGDGDRLRGARLESDGR